jgi:hypothetical protein
MYSVYIASDCANIITIMGQAGSRCERKFDTKETLALKLGCKNPVILSFVSPHCGLCRSLERDLCEVRVMKCMTVGSMCSPVAIGVD